MGQVLVLNASYEPLNITTWRRAVVMMIKGKAEGLEHDSKHLVRSDMHLPTVIRLRQFVEIMHCSILQLLQAMEPTIQHLLHQ